MTANDYLARQAALEMGSFYAFLGLKVGILQDGLESARRRDAYRCDIVVGTASQLGFDYLRDRIALGREAEVQGERRVAIIDEVDQILIDEAVTPLILSGGEVNENPAWYTIPEILAKNFMEEGKGKDYTVDKKHGSINIEEMGLHKLEILVKRMAGPGATLNDPIGMKLIAQMRNAIQAHRLYAKDQDYIVSGEGDQREIILIGKTTNRKQPGRTLEGGMHQALEAKEGFTRFSPQTKTEASISIQNYFRGYQLLAGGTGTGISEAAEFDKIYKRDIVRIPANTPSIRDDRGLLICRDRTIKEGAIIASVEESHSLGKPVLVGTGSIEESEAIGRALEEKGYKIRILNAKNKREEEEIVATAGEAGAITIATDMAGRGTNIRLSDEAKKAGGLHVIVTQGESVRRVGQLRVEPSKERLWPRSRGG